MATKAELEAELEALKARPVEIGEPIEGLNIYERINRISQEAGALAPESKGGVPFAFRGIDGTVAHLTPFMHRYGVFNTSRVLNHIVTEREVGNRVVKTTQVEVEFEFFGPDGNSVTVVTPGLADDFADRSSAQAMSVAYRIALLQLFHLPTHSKEPEETGEEVQNLRAAAPAQAKQAPAQNVATKKLMEKIVEIAGAKGIESSALNEKGNEISGKPSADGWFQDVEVLNGILAWVQEQPGE